MASARSHFHAAPGGQRRDFAGSGAGLAVAHAELAVEVITPGPDAVAGADDEGMLGAGGHANDWFAEFAHGAHGDEVRNIAVYGLMTRKNVNVF